MNEQNATEWARVDKDLNVTHLDMELCVQGPHNAYTALARAIWGQAVKHTAKECAELCDRFQARDVGMQPAECAGAIRQMFGVAP